MKNGKAAGALGLVSEMVKVTGEAEVGMITDLVNQIIWYTELFQENRNFALLQTIVREKGCFRKRKSQGTKISRSSSKDS